MYAVGATQTYKEGIPGPIYAEVVSQVELYALYTDTGCSSPSAPFVFEVSIPNTTLSVASAELTLPLRADSFSYNFYI